MEVSSTEELYQTFLKSSGVCIDTRTLKEGEIFFALKGNNFNADNFAGEALEKGAIAAVVEDPAVAGKDERILQVSDSLEALQDLAKTYRNALDIPVIAIGGSNGKTTTKELTCAVLETAYQVYATPGNFNNHIGVPLTLLGIPSDAGLAVVEMGNNHEKELYELCRIARPTHGIITNIGKDHLEGFGDIEGVARAHSELFLYLKETGGIAFVNSLDEHLSRMASRLPHVYRFPQPDDYYYCELKESGFFIELIAEDGENVQTQLIGRYNYFNVAAALCIGKFFEVPNENARRAVEGYVPANNRSQVIHKNGYTVILDAYNANPSSMESALSTLEDMDGDNKVAVLGDMKEMGTESEEEHKKIAERISNSGISRAFLCGEEFNNIRDKVNAGDVIRFFPDKQSLIKHIADEGLDASLILVKGSRALALEELVEYL